MSFKHVLKAYNWNDVKESIFQKKKGDVIKALSKERRNLEDFKSLISPAGKNFLEEMAQESHRITKQRFGKIIQMYVPMYLSNKCQNICTYCGFSFNNAIQRKVLTETEILKEISVLKKWGFEHILLVTGESSSVGINYFKKILELVMPYFSHVSMEIQPLDTKEYIELIDLGLNSVLIYQETYHNKSYKEYHTKGKKSNFYYRLETPDRLGKTGVKKIGIGTLIGLEDWRTDSFFTALHLSYLEKNYWKTKYSISFPRLRPHVGNQYPERTITDRELLQLICAYRLLNEEVELSISTRESENFRNHIIPLGITSMSAGSRTNPGGYEVDTESLEQFQIDDLRPPKKVAKMIQLQGYEAVWKDWDKAFR